MSKPNPLQQARIRTLGECALWMDEQHIYAPANRILALKAWEAAVQRCFEQIGEVIDGMEGEL